MRPRALPAFACPCLLAPLLALTLLAGCGGSPAPSDPVPALPAEREATDAFIVAAAVADPFEGRPALRVEFSQPLAQAQPFDSRILVKGPGDAVQSSGWVLGEDARSLHFPYVQADQTYTVQLGAELESADGRLLGTTPALSIYSGNLPPRLGFASQGSVLPASGSEGLPVLAVNATEADVEFFRVRPEQYSAFFASWQRNGQRGWWELDQAAGRADSVYSNRFALAGRPNERAVSFLPVHTIDPLREAGLYFAVMRRPGQFDGRLETTHFMVTDIGLHVRSYPDRLWIHVASLASGQPRSSIQIEVLDEKGQRVASGSTDNRGQLELIYRSHPAHVVVARAGREISLLPLRQPALDLAEFEVGGRAHTDLDAYAWSGRDLYRPGETVQVSALLRDFDGRPAGRDAPLFALLKQPDGRSLGTTLLEPGALGYYSFEQAIAPDAPTGRWTLELHSDPEKGRALGQFGFRVEEFLPERLKLTLDSPVALLAAGQPLPLAVDGAYLYGAPAGGNRFTAELLYRPALHPVPSRPDYHFGDPTLTLPEGPQAALDVLLPPNGLLQQTLDLLPDTAAPTAPVEVRVAASLFESGGRAVRRSLARTIWPADHLIGVRPLFDPTEGADANTRVGFEVIRSAADGSLTRAAALQVTLLREHRDYRWTWVEGSGWDSDFTRRDTPVETVELALDGERPGRVEFAVEWGEYRLQILDPSTGLTSRLPFTAGWSWSDANRGVDARPDRIKLALDKTAYQAGDRLTVTITPPHPGPGLLVVESDRLLHSQLIDARPGSQVTLEVGPEWERHDVYISAVVFRPAGRGDRAGPQRAVGVAHVPLARGDRSAALAVEAPAVLRPGERLDISLHAPEFAGQAAYAVVDAVDQGILSLTGYALPDAIAHFLVRRAFGVEARDVYARVIEQLDGTRARLRYGGDASLAALPQARRPTSRVQTVALHSGPVAFDAEGRAQVSFTAPDFNGALRIAAVAWDDTRYARAEREAIVRAPLVLEVSTPRVMAPGDRARLNVELQNLSGAARSYRVSAVAQAPLSVAGETRTISLADGERHSFGFPLRALPGHDVGRFQVRTEADDGTVLERDFELVVRPAWPAERRSAARVHDGGSEAMIGRGLLDGLMPQASQLQLTLSTVAPIPFSAAAQGLIGFPLGCIEQTSSRLWPLIWLDADTLERFGLSLDQAQRQRMIEQGFTRLAAMQLGSGQFAFWPGEGHADPQMTAHVAELLLEAGDAGLAIPQGVLDRALARLGEDLLSGGNHFYAFDHSEHLRFAASAHAGYVLARAGRAPLGALRALHDHERARSLTALPLVHLGLALRLQGDTTRGDAAIADALARQSQRPDWLGDYGSDIRDEALLLALLHEQGLADAAIGARVLVLARELHSPDAARAGLSTQEQLAMFRLGRQLLRTDSEPLAGELLVGERRITLPPTTLFNVALSGDELLSGVRARLSSNARVWIAEDLVAVSRQAPAPVSEGLHVQRGWYRMDGTPFEGGVLHEGETLIARLNVHADESVPDVLVTDLLPGGLEVENLALGDTDTLNQLVIDGQSLSERHWSAEIRHQEYRDDRYVAAVKLWPGQVARLYYLIRAVSPGEYAVPPPHAEDMYRPRVRSIGHAEPARIEVAPP
jgi:alpha-2-macroglobulin